MGIKAFTATIAAFVLLTTAATEAAPVLIDASDNGFYGDNGHVGRGKNIYTGGIGRTYYRSFHSFDLSAAAGEIVIGGSLTFAAGNGYFLAPRTATLGLYDVSTPAADLSGRTGGSGTFDDLGSGALYGTQTVNATFATAMPEVTVALSAAALNDINMAMFSNAFDFIIGAALISPHGGLWASSMGFPAATLSLETLSFGGPSLRVAPPVPLPAGLPLLLGALAGFAVLRRRG